MTPKEKAYIIHILAEARVDEKCKIIINRNNMNASDRAKEDLEKIYGIKVTKTETLWSNPDKISTMKYQTYNTNKDKK